MSLNGELLSIGFRKDDQPWTTSRKELVLCSTAQIAVLHPIASISYQIMTRKGVVLCLTSELSVEILGFASCVLFIFAPLIFTLLPFATNPSQTFLRPLGGGGSVVAWLDPSC